MGHGVNSGVHAGYDGASRSALSFARRAANGTGALVEPLAAAVHAVCEISVVRPGDVALVSGPGPIGMLCFLLLAAQGVPTIVAGTSQDANRLALARRLACWRQWMSRKSI